MRKHNKPKGWYDIPPDERLEVDQRLISNYYGYSYDILMRLAKPHEETAEKLKNKIFEEIQHENPITQVITLYGLIQEFSEWLNEEILYCNTYKERTAIHMGQLIMRLKQLEVDKILRELEEEHPGK